LKQAGQIDSQASRIGSFLAKWCFFAKIERLP